MTLSQCFGFSWVISNTMLSVHNKNVNTASWEAKNILQDYNMPQVETVTVASELQSTCEVYSGNISAAFNTRTFAIELFHWVIDESTPLLYPHVESRCLYSLESLFEIINSIQCLYFPFIPSKPSIYLFLLSFKYMAFSHIGACVLVKVFIAVRDTMSVGTLIKKTINWASCLHFRASVHFNHDSEHGSSKQTDAMLELRLPHLAGSRKSTDSHRVKLEEIDLKARPHSDILPPRKPHLLQQEHTSLYCHSFGACFL